MTSSAQALISRSVSIEGYKNPVAYDPKDIDFQGTWLCKQCTARFFGGGQPIHTSSCDHRLSNSYETCDLIFVIGDKTKGGPFNPNDFEKVKALAKNKFRETQGSWCLLS